MCLETAFFELTLDNDRLKTLVSILAKTILDQEDQISDLKDQIKSLTSPVDNPDLMDQQR